MATKMLLTHFPYMKWTATEHRDVVGRGFTLVREALGMTPTEFAKRLGITPQALWNIERGGVYPNMLVIVRACEEFQLSADWFLRGERGGIAHDMAVKLQQAEAKLAD